MMTTNPLQAVQAALEQRGVQDVKFLFNRQAYAHLPSDVASDVADVLTKYFDGKFVDVGNFSDEVLPAATA